MTEETVHLLVATRILLYMFLSFSMIISSIRYAQSRQWVITAIHVVSSFLFFSIGAISFLHFSNIIEVNSAISSLAITPILILLSAFVWYQLIGIERTKVKKAEENGKSNGIALDSA